MPILTVHATINTQKVARDIGIAPNGREKGDITHKNAANNAHTVSFCIFMLYLS